MVALIVDIRQAVHLDEQVVLGTQFGLSLGLTEYTIERDDRVEQGALTSRPVRCESPIGWTADFVGERFGLGSSLRFVILF